jgi:hypothetical protein
MFSEHTLEGRYVVEKDVLAYIFHVHLDHRIHRNSCIFNDSHPPGPCVDEERRRRCYPRDLTAPFQKRPDDFVL